MLLCARHSRFLTPWRLSDLQVWLPEASEDGSIVLNTQVRLWAACIWHTTGVQGPPLRRLGVSIGFK